MATKELTIKLAVDPADAKAGAGEVVASLKKVDDAAKKANESQKTGAKDVAEAVVQAEGKKRDAAGRFVKDQLAGVAQVKQATKQATEEGSSAFAKMGTNATASFAQMAAGAVGAQAVMTKLGQIVQGLKQSITEAANESRRLAGNVTGQRDGQRELAATLGVKNDNKFLGENLKFGRDAAMRMDEVIPFRLQVANSGVQHKGKNISDSEYTEYEKNAAALSAARGLPPSVAGDMAGGVLGLKNLTPLGDKAGEEALRMFNMQLGILGQGRGEQGVLVNQLSQVNAGLFSEEALRGSIQDPAEAATLVSTAAEKSPTAAAEMVKATLRGLQAYGDEKTGPLLTRAKVKSGQSPIEKLRLLAPVLEAEAKSSGKNVNEVISQYFPDHLTAEGVGVMINKGVSGGVFDARAAEAKKYGTVDSTFGMIDQFQKGEDGRARIAAADVAVSEGARGAENSRLDIIRKQALAGLIRDKKIDTTGANFQQFLGGMIPIGGLDEPRQNTINRAVEGLLSQRGAEVGMKPMQDLRLALPEERERIYNAYMDKMNAGGRDPLDLSNLEAAARETNALLRKLVPATPSNQTPPVIGGSGPPPAMRRPGNP